MLNPPCLPIIIHCFIEEKWLGQNPLIKPKPNISTDPDQDNPQTPFLCRYNHVYISDGIYFIPVVSRVSLPEFSSILITEWSLSYIGYLEIEIIKAQTATEWKSAENTPYLEVEYNPLVNLSMQKFKFRLIKKDLAKENQKIKEVPKLDKKKAFIKQEDFQINLKESGFKEEDFLQCFNNKKSTNKEVNSREEQNVENASDGSSVLREFDIGIDHFSVEALNYLKKKYNLI